MDGQRETHNNRGTNQNVFPGTELDQRQEYQGPHKIDNTCNDHKMKVGGEANSVIQPSNMIALRLPMELFVSSNTSRAYISMANLPENDINRKTTFSLMNGFI